MENTESPDFRYSSSGTNGTLRSPRISSAGYPREPPPPYPGPSAPAHAGASQPDSGSQPFYLWSGAVLPGQVPAYFDQPPRSIPHYPSPPPPPQRHHNSSMRHAAPVQVRILIFLLYRTCLCSSRPPCVYVLSRCLVTEGGHRVHVTLVMSSDPTTIIIATRGYAQ